MFEISLADAKTQEDTLLQHQGGIVRLREKKGSAGCDKGVGRAISKPFRCLPSFFTMMTKSSCTRRADVVKASVGVSKKKIPRV